MTVTVRVGKQGRIVMPAEVREQLDLKPGDELSVTVSGRQVQMMKPEDAVAELHGMFKDIHPERSAVDELIAERRAVAARGG